MSAVVTLNVYSGRPDPAWELSNEDARALANMLKNVSGRTLSKPPGVAGLLGYRGFTIQSVGERDLDAEIFLHAGIADLGRFDLNLSLGSPEVEKFLLRSGQDKIDESLFTYVDQAIDSSGENLMATLAAAAPPPPFNPGKWNNDPNVRARNNCYNYANDKITNTFAQPGRGSGQIYASIDCNGVGPASQRDGQIAVPNPNVTPADGWVIALVIWPGRDFHWYRRDANNMWSHKPGQTPARNVDNSGRVINAPATCDRGPYTIICGYYNNVPSRTRIN
jgi:hypothetical protein